jgi:hypothetical protein
MAMTDGIRSFIKDLLLGKLRSHKAENRVRCFVRIEKGTCSVIKCKHTSKHCQGLESVGCPSLFYSEEQSRKNTKKVRTPESVGSIKSYRPVAALKSPQLLQVSKAR